MRILSIVAAGLATLAGLLYYGKKELLFGHIWVYSPLWLQHPVIFSAYHLGLHSMINASRIIHSYEGMKPNNDDLSKIKVDEISLNSIPAHVYRPVVLENRTDSPAVIYLTGTEFIYGGKESHNGFCYRLARSAEVVVFLIEFKKPPEFIFPIPFNDCYEASVYLVNNAEKFNIDPKRIILMGDGSGGNLVAAVAQQLAEIKKGCVQFSFLAQILIYPTLQFFDFTLPSFLKDVGELSVTKETIASSWSYYIHGTPNLARLFLSGNHSYHFRETPYQLYLQSIELSQPYNVDSTSIPETVLKALLDPRACPLLADNLQQNPRTLVVTAEHDVLRDDGTIYAVRLRQAGVKVEHKSYLCKHNFLYYDYDGWYCPNEAKQAFRDIVSYMRGIIEGDVDL